MSIEAPKRRLATARRLVGAVVLAAFALTGIALLLLGRIEARYQAPRTATAQQAETYFIPPHPVLRLASLGREPFLGDLLFVRANIYFGSHLFGDRIFDWLDLYVDAILALTPDNPRVYEWATQSVKYGQYIDNETIERSNGYALRGIEQFPDNWRFYVDVGFNFLMEWQPASEQEAEEMRKKALSYFSVAAALPGSQLDPNFVASLYLRRNDVAMGLFHAYLRYWEASERERRELRARIARYGSLATAQDLEATEKRWKERYPYLPFDLYELLDEGPEEEAGGGGRTL